METAIGSSIVVDKDMAERFRAIQRQLGVNTRVMAIKSGVPEAKLYQFLAGRQNLTLESLRLLKKAYPDISTEYLINNQGSALISQGQFTDDVQTVYITKPVNVQLEVRDQTSTK
ncbi:hypothetical protein [Spirosoma sp. 48-14]|uniref:hypothetical protein n=1 Tax=Spirosoma sp. 48-14 TaxID=1895854 RepID=UPI00095D015A|nr:hypothetical protein [Spirosoma sp. 48-14]OJW75680.1 MAG: hypothetical protein BGO59_08935 [Spirosoma sp. 48-14]